MGRKRVYSEYEGGGVNENTVFPQGPDALTASDKLRLQSLTGQEENSNAPIDPYHWYGGQDPGEQVDPTPQQRQRALIDEDKTRYNQY